VEETASFVTSLKGFNVAAAQGFVCWGGMGSIWWLTGKVRVSVKKAQTFPQLSRVYCVKSEADPLAAVHC